MEARTMNEWIVIVPARGGSVGIPGKNRRAIHGSTLVERAIDRALAFAPPWRVIVSTDDPIVADLAEFRGCRLMVRPDTLAGPDATIHDVVAHVLENITDDERAMSVAVCQPTSPSLDATTVGEIVAEFENHPEWQTLATVVADTHLMWHETENDLRPIFTERVNRQDRRDTIWRETGGLMLVRSWTNTPTLVSGAHHLWPLDEHEAIDVDTPLDLVTATAALSSRVIEWRVVAGQSVGYGHIFRTLALAAELPHHDHRWVVDGPIEARAIVGQSYPVIAYGERYEYVADLVVFDCLNVASIDYDDAREDGSLVIGIELDDLPEDARLDVYLDELGGRVPDPLVARSSIVRVGPAFASIRDEFRIARRALDTGAVDDLVVPRRVLVTFGGEDPHGMTERVMDALVGHCDVRAIIGPGFAPEYAHRLRTRFAGHIVETASVRMSREMLAAPVVVTSTGRTVWEAAMLGCALVTIPVNERERDHAFPWYARRVHPGDLDADTIRLLVDACLVEPSDARIRLERSNEAGIDGYGPRRFAWLVDGLIGGYL
jgi:CMP-N-acetylneuraminic acid synthetase/spore coat polysaccharide biosynthesis predicted glycosyltransferase SpsG